MAECCLLRDPHEDAPGSPAADVNDERSDAADGAAEPDGEPEVVADNGCLGAQAGPQALAPGTINAGIRQRQQRTRSPSTSVAREQMTESAHSHPAVTDDHKDLPKPPAGCLAVVVLTVLALLVGFLLLQSAPVKKVCLHIQRSTLSNHEGFTLPVGLDPEDIVQFLQNKGLGWPWKRLAYELCESHEQGGSFAMYVTACGTSRWDETLFDSSQLQRLGTNQLSAFLLVRDARHHQCKADDLTRDVQEYVHDKVGRDIPIVWLCYWDGQLSADASLPSWVSAA